VANASDHETAQAPVTDHVAEFPISQKQRAALPTVHRIINFIAMKTILVVDDEPKITQLVRDYLERAGVGVLVAYDGKKALSLAKTEKPDMVVLDLGCLSSMGWTLPVSFAKYPTRQSSC
jgi:PleD family two-component response regulator